MFSNRQQDNSSNLLHQTISTSGTIGLPSPPPTVSIATIAANSNNLTVTSVATTILALDSLNCGGIPTRTTPTLTPTTLRNIAADIASLSPGASEDFAAAAASDLHHLVSPSCTTLNMSSSGPSDRLSSDLQDRHTLQNLGIQHLSLQNLNNQHLNLNDLQNQQNLNQNSLNQQQQNDYNNSFSSAVSRQAGFVPPLVLQINSNSTNIPQSSGISNNSSSSNSIFSSKGTSTSASSSHWHGAVVTQRPHSQTNSRIKQRFTDDEECDEDNDSAADYGTDSSDTMPGKVTQKQNTKNNSKSRIKSESKNTTNSGRRTNNKDNKIMSAEEEQRRQIRRERNKLAAARCRKRRMDHTNELLVETEQLEDKRLRLQVEIQGLRQQKTSLQDMLAQHKCTMNNGSVSNSVSAVNHITTVLDSNDISESSNVLSSNLSTTKRNSLQQQNISTNMNSDNNSNNGGDSIKCENHTAIQSNIDNKDNMDIIPSSVLQQPQRRRPTTLLEPINGNFSNIKKISGNDSTGVVVLNFESLMDGGTGLTPVSTNVGTVQNHHQQIQHNASSSVSTDNSGVLS